MKYTYYLLLFLFLSSCYNPYMRINQEDETLSRSARCTDPILEDITTRTAGIYILSKFLGGDRGELLEEKNNFIFMDMSQKFPKEWITPFEQGLLLTIPVEDIFYENDGRRLMDIGEQRLTQLSALLAEYPEASFIVEGHNDTNIHRKKNLKIAFRQAKKVGQFLRKRNVDKQRFEVISYGCQQRLTESGAENNRIEVAIVNR